MAAPMHPRSGAEVAARRATGGVFAGVVLATCGVYAAVTIAPIVAYDVTGSVFLAGLPVGGVAGRGA